MWVHVISPGRYRDLQACNKHTMIGLYGNSDAIPPYVKGETMHQIQRLPAANQNHKKKTKKQNKIYEKLKYKYALRVACSYFFRTLKKSKKKGSKSIAFRPLHRKQ